MRYVQGFNRHHAVLFPTCIEELIPADAGVLIIDAETRSMVIHVQGVEKQVLSILSKTVPRAFDVWFDEGMLRPAGV